jgi:exopolyphosphatase/guanosine-5'-triphosphate,3'-diphosphate pyrophosphatase
MLAAIDMGSNSFRLHIGRFENGAIHIVRSASEPVRLAEGLDRNGFLTEEAIKRGTDALARLFGILSTYPLRAVRAVATHTLRVARNAHEFLQAAEKALGYPIEVITGEEEGRLIYLGVANVLAEPEESRLVIDIGGGSTELILGKGSAVRRAESFSVGTVRQSLSFFPEGIISQAGFEAAILSARSSFEDVASYYDARNWKCVYGSSGTVRSITEIISLNGLDKGLFFQDNLTALRESMVSAGNIGNMNYAGMKAARSASIVGGLAILTALVRMLRIKLVSPVEGGLRMGVMWKLHFQSAQRDRAELESLPCLNAD